jgi:hypothetical protein
VAGKFKAALGSEACSGCDAGKFSLSAGASLCTECQAGGTSTQGSSRCGCTSGYESAVSRLGHHVMEFGGASTDFVEVQQSSSINFVDKSFSWAVWARRAEDSPDEYQTILAFRSGWSSNSRLHVGYGGSGSVFIFDFYNNALKATLPDDGKDKGVWVHWAGSYDKATKTRTLYRNGVEVASDVSPSHLVGSSGNLGIGAYSGNGFKGRIDDLLLLTRKVSASEVSLIFREQTLVDTTGLALKFDFNEETGAVLDSSNNGNQGTLRGTCSRIQESDAQVPGRPCKVGALIAMT